MVPSQLDDYPALSRCVTRCPLVQLGAMGALARDHAGASRHVCGWPYARPAAVLIALPHLGQSGLIARGWWDWVRPWRTSDERERGAVMCRGAEHAARRPEGEVPPRRGGELRASGRRAPVLTVTVGERAWNGTWLFAGEGVERGELCETCTRDALTKDLALDRAEMSARNTPPQISLHHRGDTHSICVICPRSGQCVSLHGKNRVQYQ